jgi:hypothetical protein
MSGAGAAKELKDRRSVSGYIVYLEGAPVMFKSSTERTVCHRPLGIPGKEGRRRTNKCSFICN